MRTYLAVVFIIIAIIGCEVESEPELRPTPRPPAPTPTPVVSVQDIQAMAISSIETQPMVVEAAISQDGNEISLVLIVGYAIDRTHAEQLADSFLRMTKSLLKDGAPGKDIGPGEYDYVIGVYYPNEDQIALGAKSRGSSQITW